MKKDTGPNISRRGPSPSPTQSPKEKQKHLLKMPSKTAIGAGVGAGTAAAIVAASALLKQRRQSAKTQSTSVARDLKPPPRTIPIRPRSPEIIDSAFSRPAGDSSPENHESLVLRRSPSLLERSPETISPTLSRPAAKLRLESDESHVWRHSPNLVQQPSEAINFALSGPAGNPSTRSQVSRRNPSSLERPPKRSKIHHMTSSNLPAAQESQRSPKPLHGAEHMFVSDSHGDHKRRKHSHPLETASSPPSIESLFNDPEGSSVTCTLNSNLRSTLQVLGAVFGTTSSSSTTDLSNKDAFGKSRHASPSTPPRGSAANALMQTALAMPSSLTVTQAAKKALEKLGFSDKNKWNEQFYADFAELYPTEGVTAYNDALQNAKITLQPSDETKLAETVLSRYAEAFEQQITVLDNLHNETRPYSSQFYALRLGAALVGLKLAEIMQCIMHSPPVVEMLNKVPQEFRDEIMRRLDTSFKTLTVLRNPVFLQDSTHSLRTSMTQELNQKMSQAQIWQNTNADNIIAFLGLALDEHALQGKAFRGLSHEDARRPGWQSAVNAREVAEAEWNGAFYQYIHQVFLNFSNKLSSAEKQKITSRLASVGDQEEESLSQRIEKLNRSASRPEDQAFVLLEIAYQSQIEGIAALINQEEFKKIEENARVATPGSQASFSPELTGCVALWEVACAGNMSTATELHGCVNEYQKRTHPDKLHIPDEEKAKIVKKTEGLFKKLIGCRKEMMYKEAVTTSYKTKGETEEQQSKRKTQLRLELLRLITATSRA